MKTRLHRFHPLEMPSKPWNTVRPLSIRSHCDGCMQRRSHGWQNAAHPENTPFPIYLHAPLKVDILNLSKQSLHTLMALGHAFQKWEASGWVVVDFLIHDGDTYRPAVAVKNQPVYSANHLRPAFYQALHSRYQDEFITALRESDTLRDLYLECFVRAPYITDIEVFMRKIRPLCERIIELMEDEGGKHIFRKFHQPIERHVPHCQSLKHTVYRPWIHVPRKCTHRKIDQQDASRGSRCFTCDPAHE